MKIIPLCAAVILLLLALNNPVYSQKIIWDLTRDEGICLQVGEKSNHSDHIEMSGLKVSAIVHYGKDNNYLKLKMHLVFPMLRTIPNDTHASLAHEFNYADFQQLKVGGLPVEEFPVNFRHKGIMGIESRTNADVTIHHQLFPSTDMPAMIDIILVQNTSGKNLEVEIPEIKKVIKTDPGKGVYGSYIISAYITKKGIYSVDPAGSLQYAIIYAARAASDRDWYISADYEWQKRKSFVENILNDLVFESPNDTLNRAFAFAKIRATESIYYTKGGLMHGPGGGRYYAAIWANDQAEYANPFFPFLGNPEGNESAINSFRHFARYINSAYKPIPSSIIAEGTDYWNGAGDRGDMAMIAYGATRFALSYGNKKTATELWPLITWCLEYNRRKVNKYGVVTSDSDELEGRFPAGKANLNTSSLYYDALISAEYIGKELGIPQNQSDVYRKQATEIRNAIEKYFGATVEGFHTYRYYEGNDILRSWICTPLTVDIFDRKMGTIEALFSSRLWTDDGLLTQAGDKTFWDRSTLYGLRGAFAAGETRQTMPFCLHYSAHRLLGGHVPYPVEAYPEGNQRHLSAESALYCRVVTEGIFGIRPTGFSSFTLRPQLYGDWPQMALRNIKAFGTLFDIEVIRHGKLLRVKVISNNAIVIEKIIDNGQTIEVELKS